MSYDPNKRTKSLGELNLLSFILSNYIGLYIYLLY